MSILSIVCHIKFVYQNQIQYEFDSFMYVHHITITWCLVTTAIRVPYKYTYNQ